MKNVWRKGKYIVLAMICFNLVALPMSVYATENNKIERTTQSESDKKGDKGNKQQEEVDSIQVYLTLAAIFGVGTLTAVLSSVLYKLYLSKKVVALPVLYYGEKEEVLYE